MERDFESLSEIFQRLLGGREAAPRKRGRRKALKRKAVPRYDVRITVTDRVSEDRANVSGLVRRERDFQRLSRKAARLTRGRLYRMF